MVLLKEKLVHIELQNIVSNRYQPREHFDGDGIAELALSIQEVGLLHPPLVRPIFGTDQYEIVSGERRVMACRYLGYTEIAAIVRMQMGHFESAKAALVENIQRIDLNPLEVSRSIKAMLCEFELSQEELAGQVGKKRSTVANYLRLLQLPPVMQESISEGRLSMAHAKVLLSCTGREREHLFKEILTKELTVRQATEWVHERTKRKKKKGASPKMKDLHASDLAARLQDHFQTKVVVENKNGQGSVNIHFYNLDDLDRILEMCHAL